MTLVIEKYFGDIKQEEKHVLDLLEAMMRPPCLVKEELRQMLFKMIQISLKIKEFRVSSFGIPEIRCCPAGGHGSLLTSKF